MHRKRKLYVAVMMLGGLALLVDRLILPTSALPIAEAIASGDPHVGSTHPTVASSLDQAMSMPEVPFPPGLTTLDEQAVIRDLFAPPSPAARFADNALDGRITERPPDHMSSADFMTQHRLQAVLYNPRLKIAVVDGTWVRLGEAIDGCTLLCVKGGEVRFECFDGEALLRVAIGRGASGG